MPITRGFFGKGALRMLGRRVCFTSSKCRELLVILVWWDTLEQWRYLQIRGVRCKEGVGVGIIRPFKALGRVHVPSIEHATASPSAKILMYSITVFRAVFIWITKRRVAE